ncbi:MAG: VOC family protein [Anaerolineae bacterium]|nr:VOC family protein [Anaerolineae bacterium]
MTKRGFAHIEIPAKDRDAAAKFYHTLFGWECQHMGEPSPYTTFQTGNVGGGFPDVSDDNPIGSVIVYIESTDLEADGSLIEQHGGKLLSPTFQVGEYGWMRYFEDPSGNKLALWKNA